MGVRTLGGGEVLEAWIPQLQERACWGHGLSVGLRGTRLSPGVRDICHLLLPQVNASAPRGFPFHSSDIQRDELVRRGRSGGEVRGWHPGCNLQSRSALDPGEPQRYSWSPFSPGSFRDWSVPRGLVRSADHGSWRRLSHCPILAASAQEETLWDYQPWSGGGEGQTSR